MSHRDTVKLRSNAKVNLYLKVLDRRPDGYHNIETVFHSISLSDTLTLSRRESGFTISCASPDVPLDENNLALLAAKRLLGEGRGGVHIDIEKRIPVAAGLGGGSADAAASLVGVNLLFDLGLSDADLMGAAAELGSDVPFMLSGGCALGEGRGEKLTPLKCLPRLPVVVVAPPVGVSTRWAYESLRSGLTSGGSRGNIIADARRTGAVESVNSLLYNDFEALVFERHPLILGIKEGLQSDGAAGALMSGSGSAVFGIFEKDGDAEMSIARFKDEGLSVYSSSFEESGVSTFS
jgi:4-diphosphocytidyl-2-C-methyl-D-erythritol kinase